MNKEHILEEIKRTAKANGGVPLGTQRFFTETEIKHSDWYGKYWVRWGDAVREAGFTPNQLNEAYSHTWLIEKFIALTRELGRLPVSGDLRMKARNDKGFPSHSVFGRLGSKRELISKVVEYCKEHKGFEDVLPLCGAVAKPDETLVRDNHTTSEKIGYVYLLKHGLRRDYKIGKTFNPLRREGEIALQLPEKLVPIHYIKTDDPSGVENYWHTRFADKRKEGEWFALASVDVRAFKKWKRIY
jgi:hypothetical protein